MEYKCKICIKDYSSYQSLWIHNKKYHITNIHNIPQSIHNIPQKTINCCQYCKKELSRSDSLKRHEKICKNKDDIIIELKNKMEQMQSQLLTLINKNKIHPQTIKKINNGIINNGTINNTYIKFGRVDISKLLSDKEVINILNRKYNSIEEAIKRIHFNLKRPEYMNIYITNLHDANCYVFDGYKFSTQSKDDVIMDLISNYGDEIELNLDHHKNNLSEHTKKTLTNFIEQLNSEDKYVDCSNKFHKNYKLYKLTNIKRKIYDMSDAKTLALLNKLDLIEKVIDSESDIEV